MVGGAYAPCWADRPSWTCLSTATRAAAPINLVPEPFWLLNFLWLVLAGAVWRCFGGPRPYSASEFRDQAAGGRGATFKSVKGLAGPPGPLRASLGFARIFVDFPASLQGLPSPEFPRTSNTSSASLASTFQQGCPRAMFKDSLTSKGCRV